MDEVLEPVTEYGDLLMPSIAKRVGWLFPELGGRSLAVVDARITKENIPTLPLAMVAFARETSDQPDNARRTQFQIDTMFVIEFWMEPERYQTKDCGETPFWSYYDYEDLRNRLLSGFASWRGPKGERISYVSLTTDTDTLAVVLTFTMKATWNWCDETDRIPDATIDEQTFQTKLCSPQGVCPEAFEVCEIEPACPPVEIGPNYSQRSK